MQKLPLFILSLTVVLIVGFATYFFNNLGYTSNKKNEIESAVGKAKVLYLEKKQRREDISNGPCLSNALMPNWVADIAHFPRQAIDDLPENQCSAYVEGGAAHFVELDLNGNLIRAK